jgi:Mo-dependent nitrogenase C-terminus
MNAHQFNLFILLQKKLDAIAICNSQQAEFLCRLIPASCPFERDLKLGSRTFAHIPPLCKLNPFYEYAEKILNFKAWLTRMTHNLCVDIHRERQRREKSIESIEAIADREDGAVISSFDLPESTILRREREAYIRHAVNALPYSPPVRERSLRHPGGCSSWFEQSRKRSSFRY